MRRAIALRTSNEKANGLPRFRPFGAVTAPAPPAAASPTAVDAATAFRIPRRSMGSDKGVGSRTSAIRSRRFVTPGPGRGGLGGPIGGRSGRHAGRMVKSLRRRRRDRDQGRWYGRAEESVDFGTQGGGGGVPGAQLGGPRYDRWRLD